MLEGMDSRLRGNNQEARECWKGWIPASAGTTRGCGNAVARQQDSSVGFAALGITGGEGRFPCPYEDRDGSPPSETFA